MGNFYPYGIDTLNQQPKKILTGDYTCAAYSAKSVHRWLLDKQVKYKIFLFIPFLGELIYRSDQSTNFQLHGSNDADSCKDVPLGFCIYYTPFRSKIPQNINVGGVNRCFPAKFAYYLNFHTMETIGLIATKFCTMTETTKYSSWVVQI